MARICLSRYAFPVEFEIEADFFFMRSHIRTLRHEERVSLLSGGERNYEVESSRAILAVEIECELHDFDSLFEGGLYARPRLMIILGLISYLADVPLLPYDSMGKIDSLVEEAGHPIDPVVNHFRISGIDRSQLIRGLAQTVTSAPESTRLLIISALDRFRRGLHFESQSEEEPLYDDEAFLAYYQILELFARHYERELRRNADGKITHFLDDYFSNQLLHDSEASSDEVRKLRRQILDLIKHPDDFAVRTQLRYFLNRMNLYPAGISELVDRLTKIRNKIAHGQQVYREDLIWPVPQFFPLSTDSSAYSVYVKTLAARSISQIAGVDAWSNRWQELVDSLHPTRAEVRDFFRTHAYEQISVDDFVSGSISMVTPQSVVDCFIDGAYGIQHSQLESCLKRVIDDSRASSEWAQALVYGVAVLADSADSAIANRCRSLIAAWLVDRSTYIETSALRTIWQELRYRGFILTWLPEYLNSRASWVRG